MFKILIVEDDKELSLLFQKVLEKSGYQVKSASDGAQAQSSPNLCVNSSSSYISPSMLPLSSGDLIEWSLVCHSILSYQKFCD